MLFISADTNIAKFFRQIKNYRAYANDKCKETTKRCIAIYNEPKYVRLFVYLFSSVKKRCGKENEVVKPQAFPPSLFSKRNNNPTRLKTIISQSKMSKNC